MLTMSISHISMYWILKALHDVTIFVQKAASDLIDDSCHWERFQHQYVCLFINIEAYKVYLSWYFVMILTSRPGVLKLSALIFC